MRLGIDFNTNLILDGEFPLLQKIRLRSILELKVFEKLIIFIFKTSLGITALKLRFSDEISIFIFVILEPDLRLDLRKKNSELCISLSEKSYAQIRNELIVSIGLFVFACGFHVNIIKWASFPFCKIS